MKKVLIIFAFIAIFMLQLNVVSAVSYKLADGNINLDDEYNNMNTETASCGKDEKSGDYLIDGIPSSIPKVAHIVYMVLQIAIPVLLVVIGTVDLVKAVIASKEDEIKKAQMTFVKRLIAGALVFFIFVVVKLLISFAADNNNSSRIMDCADCLLNGTSNCEISE